MFYCNVMRSYLNRRKEPFPAAGSSAATPYGGARPFPHNRLVLIHRLDPNLLGDANRHYEQARRLLALHKCSTPKNSLSRLLRMRWQAQANVLMASLSVLLRLLLEQMQGFSGSTTCSSLLA